MAGKGGGAWKVAYADFVTAMMAFFMVMWLTAQKPEVKQAVAGYFRDPYAIFHGSDSGASGEGIPSPDAKNGHPVPTKRVRVANTGDNDNYHFPVQFAEGSGELDAAAREAIRSFAPTMVGKLNRVDVRAHSERQPLPEGSPYKDRWDLCYARAHAVMAELLAQGIEEDRIRLGQASSNEPMATNLSDEELKLNSRVEVTLLPDLVDTPGAPAPEESVPAGDAETADAHSADEAPAHSEPAAHDSDHAEDSHH